MGFFVCKRHHLLIPISDFPLKSFWLSQICQEPINVSKSNALVLSVPNSSCSVKIAEHCNF